MQFARGCSRGRLICTKRVDTSGHGWSACSCLLFYIRKGVGPSRRKPKEIRPAVGCDGAAVPGSDDWPTSTRSWLEVDGQLSVIAATHAGDDTLKDVARS